MDHVFVVSDSELDDNEDFKDSLAIPFSKKPTNILKDQNKRTSSGIQPAAPKKVKPTEFFRKLEPKASQVDAPPPKAPTTSPELDFCPICNFRLSKLVVLDMKEAHINRCLDKAFTSRGRAQETSKIETTSSQAPDMKTRHVPIPKTEVKNVFNPTLKIESETGSTQSSKTGMEKISSEPLEIDMKLEHEQAFKTETVYGQVSKADVVPTQSPNSTLMPDKTELLRRGSMVKNPDQPILITCPDLSHQARSKLKRELPMGKKVPHTTFTVDAFNIGPIPGCRAYFLSHYHSDHYGGMGKTFAHGTIVTSQITARLVQSQIGVKPDYVLGLDTNTLYEIDGVRVILIDANHCPGAVLFLFEVPTEGSDQPTRILHTGDFRLDDNIHLDPSSLIMAKPIDYLYLDTTYCNPNYAFPEQSRVLKASTENALALYKASPAAFGSSLLRLGFTLISNKPETLRYDKIVVCGSYSIGKERIFISIARELKSKIFVTERKRNMLLTFQDPELESLLTNDPLQAAVHVQSMGIINAKGLKDYYNGMKVKNPNLREVIGIRPTGWTFSNRYAPATPAPAVSSDDQVPISTGHTSPTVKIFGVPYSEHSSYAELRRFVAAIAERRTGHTNELIVIPTVNPANIGYGQVSAWIKGWVSSVN